MAKIQFLTILLVVTCLLGGVVSVTDREIKDMLVKLEQLSDTVEQQSMTNEHQTRLIQELKDENRMIVKKMAHQNDLIEKLSREHQYCDRTLIQNSTLEERVAILEVQVMDIRENLTTIDENMSDLEGDVNFLFDEQVIQDERLLNLEEITIGIGAELDLIEDDLQDLQATAVALDFRLTVLEENGNSSIAGLEQSVESLQNTSVNHELRISVTEDEVTGLQINHVDLDVRLTTLEEIVGSEVNDTIAFSAALTAYSNITEGSALLFNEVLLNEGDGYDNTTGTFTVPSGGDGYYYFFTYFLVNPDVYGGFDIRINGETLCMAFTDQRETSNFGQAACSAVSNVVEGDTVQVMYDRGVDTTPLYVETGYYWHGFTGYRI